MATSAKIENWAQPVAYTIDETVVVQGVAAEYNDKIYRCIADHTSMSFVGDYGNNYWELIQTRGIQGPDGPQGPQGPQGNDGADGAAGANGAAGADGIFSVIADQPTAEAGVDNTEGMSPLRVKQAIDFNLIADRANIVQNAADIAQNVLDIAQNASDIAAIVIDSAQIITNTNDIAGHTLDIAQNAADIAAIVIDNAQIATNQADIATINNTTVPALQTVDNQLSARISVLESSFVSTVATGKQRVNNNQAAPQDILGVDLPGEDGAGNRFELNSSGARSARVHIEIYRQDDAEVRFTTVMLLMHFIPGLNTWAVERESTTVMAGGDDGLTFDVTTTNPSPGVYVGTVNYVSDNMVGGNYVVGSYVKFRLQEIVDTF